MYKIIITEFIAPQFIINIVNNTKKDQKKLKYKLKYTQNNLNKKWLFKTKKKQETQKTNGIKI